MSAAKQYAFKGKSGKEYMFDVYPLMDVKEGKVNFADERTVVVVAREESDGSMTPIEIREIDRSPRVLLNEWGKPLKGGAKLKIEYHNSTHVAVLRHPSMLMMPIRECEEDLSRAFPDAALMTSRP